MPPRKKISKKLLNQLAKRFGQESLAVVGAAGGVAPLSGVDAVLPTGSIVLDRWVIGVGGYPYGHVTELWGKEASGKTTLLLRAIAQCQAEGGFVHLRDAEQKIQPDWARTLGVDWDDLQANGLQRIGTVEDYIDMAEILMKGVEGAPFLTALDSLAFLESREEEGKDGEAAIGANARAWAKKMKGFIEDLAVRRGAFVFCNQPRNKITTFGAFPQTPGGNAMKCAPILRLKVESKDKWEDPRRGKGPVIRVTANKNQMAPPWRSCDLRLSELGFFDEAWNVVNHAKDVGCLDKKQDRRHWREALENLGWSDGTDYVGEQIERNERIVAGG